MGARSGCVARVTTRCDSVVLSQNPHQMKKPQSKPARLGPPLLIRTQDRLMRSLVLQAQSRGDTLKALAQHLGVTYEQVASWRRGESHIRNSRREIHRRAAEYLGLPMVLVLVLAEVIGPDDFTWPADASLEARLERDLRALQCDPFFGAFVPEALASSSVELKLFVAMMYREDAGPGPSERGARWLEILERVVAGGRAPGEDDADAPEPESGQQVS